MAGPKKKRERDKLVLVCAQVGKEFLDTKQNERIELIRAGDTARTGGQLKAEPTPLWASGQFL